MTKLLTGGQQVSSAGHGAEVEKFMDSECRGQIVGASPRMVELRERVGRLACMETPVLICGEGGSGKLAIAEAIHLSSPRSHAPLVKFHCAAGSAEAVEEALFDGMLARADGGTLVLEEVGALSMSAQVKLFRFIRERRSEERDYDLRIIATSIRPLADDVAAERFRADLYFLLNVVPLEVPPLRERPSDIPLLVARWSERFCRASGITVAGFTPDALRLLAQHPWPGNLQELEGALERAVVFAGGERPLDAGAFAFLAQQTAGGVGGAGEATAPEGEEPLITLDELERRHVLRALEFTRQNRTRAAGLLNISVRTLRNKLHQYRNEGLLASSDTPESVRTPFPGAENAR